MRSPVFVPLHHSGECDRCHYETVKTLYGFEDDEEGDWQYCGRCAEKISRHRAMMIHETDLRRSAWRHLRPPNRGRSL